MVSSSFNRQFYLRDKILTVIKKTSFQSVKPSRYKITDTCANPSIDVVKLAQPCARVCAYVCVYDVAQGAGGCGGIIGRVPCLRYVITVVHLTGLGGIILRRRSSR